MSNFWETRIEYLKGVGTQKADLLNKELKIIDYKSLIQYFPFRHEDRTKIYTINELTPDMPYVQLRGKVMQMEVIGEDAKKRLMGHFVDNEGNTMQLLWFQGVSWVMKTLKVETEYLVFGVPQFYNGRYSIVHPELELFTSAEEQTGFLQPIYNLTEKLKKRFITNKVLATLVRNLINIGYNHIEENLPAWIIQKYRFASRQNAIYQIHFPQSPEWLNHAKRRLKFEELFFIQLRLLKQNKVQKIQNAGLICEKLDLLNEFYDKYLPFDLTNAQKRVCKEVHQDMVSGRQMNRLIQGDVGSGKTMVAFICMLMVVSNGSQACMVAPTEILAEQHYEGLKIFADKLGITIDLLTGSTRQRDRRVMHERLMNGNLNILIGTHALFEDKVQFENLGLCVIDEQHRFGVQQRAKLWQKNPVLAPHILVMTATPIPRTLAMTLYGDLDVSIIDELPAGRKPIITAHRYDSNRLRVFEFMREELKKGRQIYIVYPLIEESEKLSYKNIMDGYESISRAFPEYHISMVHGQLSSVDKDFEMQRFKNMETQIMVATTVIEVGVNVPNASVMVIENAEKFGLSQLHQLRGRVGRGGEQSYCILMTEVKLSADARVRLQTMERTNNGFEIADVDLSLRGAGDIAGTQQSGVIDLVIADLAKDAIILQEARKTADEILEKDTYLESEENIPIKNYIANYQKQASFWSRIS
jgi:ATP-dependent DNA helicase RecG